jgi:hypothetical protein
MNEDKYESDAELVDLSVEFGPYGVWDGTITLTNGKIVRATELVFEPGDGIVDKGDDYVTIKGMTDYGINGVRLLVSPGQDAELQINLQSISIETRISEVLKQNRVTRVVQGKEKWPDIGIAVRTSAYKSERYRDGLYDMPAEKYAVKQPRDIIQVAGNGTELINQRHPLTIALDRAIPEQIGYRRLPSGSSDRLLLQMYTGDPDGEYDRNCAFSVQQIVFQGKSQPVQHGPAHSIYLELPAFIGYYDTKVGYGDTWQELAVPASSIQLDGPNMIINGDRFLAKGTLIQWWGKDVYVKPTAVTSFLMKNMGINTVVNPPSSYFEPWGFASISRTVELTIEKNTVQDDSDQQFLSRRDELIGKVPEFYREYISSPMDAATFFSNETVKKGNAWANYLSPIDQYGRQDSYLAHMYNAAKKVSPMMPVSFANHMPWYRPMPWLDMIMYNSYYPVDRYALPIDEFAEWQGYPDKPVFHKEFSANTYLDEIYQGGRNNPVFGKIRQWAFTKRWHDYMSIGSLGGGLYANFDYKSQQAFDGNTSSFGIFTTNQEPKQIAYGVWQAYTDLIFHDDGSVENRRDYPLRQVELMMYGDDGARLERIEALEAGQRMRLDMPERFYWAAQYYTHGGILNQPSGAYPEELFRHRFGSLLPANESKLFSQQLVDTDIIGWDGETDHYLMGKFKNKDHVITAAFQKAPGEYYLTAWVQKNPNTGTKSESHTLTFFDTGDVRVLDDITGVPLDKEVDYEVQDGKLVFPNLELPLIGRSIHERSQIPIHLPVIQVSRSRFQENAAEPLPPHGIPDQFQLWHDGSAAFGDGITESIGQQIRSLYNNLRSFIVMPLPDCGRPEGDITARLYIRRPDFLPIEQQAERSIAGDVWTRCAGEPLSIDFGVELEREGEYMVDLTSDGDKSNYRNLAVSGLKGCVVTPSYGGGEALVLRDGNWQSVADGKESLFFITIAEARK